MKTLLKLFLLPRLKSIGILLALSGGLLIVAAIFKQPQLVFMSIFLAMMFMGYNLLNSHFIENIEWLKNSTYSSRKLFMYYLLEQFIIFSLLAFSLLTFIGIAVIFMSLMQEEGSMMLAEGAEQSKVLSSNFLSQNYYSNSESALETVFALFFLFAFVFGAEITKAYFIRLRLERRFAKETYIFNGLIGVVMLFLYLKDTSVFSAIVNMKIIIIPVFIGLMTLALLSAVNNTFKFFKPKINSWLLVYPLSLFIMTFGFSLGFSKLNHGLAHEVDEKIAETRFQWLFSKEFSEKEIQEYYLNVIHPNNLEYLVNNYNDVSPELFEGVLAKRKTMEGLVLVTKLWPLKTLGKSNVKAFFDKFDKRTEEQLSKYQRRKYIRRLYKANEEFFKEEKGLKLESKVYAHIRQEYAEINDVKRSIASQKEKTPNSQGSNQGKK
jgi:hypothetical protein